MVNASGFLFNLLGLTFSTSSCIVVYWVSSLEEGKMQFLQRFLGRISKGKTTESHRLITEGKRGDFFQFKVIYWAATKLGTLGDILPGLQRIAEEHHLSVSEIEKGEKWSKLPSDFASGQDLVSFYAGTERKKIAQITFYWSNNDSISGGDAHFFIIAISEDYDKKAELLTSFVKLFNVVVDEAVKCLTG